MKQRKKASRRWERRLAGLLNGLGRMGVFALSMLLGMTAISRQMPETAEYVLLILLALLFPLVLVFAFTLWETLFFGYVAAGPSSPLVHEALFLLYLGVTGYISYQSFLRPEVAHATQMVQYLAIVNGVLLVVTAVLALIKWQQRKQEIQQLQQENIVERALSGQDEKAFQQLFLWKERADYQQFFRIEKTRWLSKVASMFIILGGGIYIVIGFLRMMEMLDNDLFQSDIHGLLSVIVAFAFFAAIPLIAIVSRDFLRAVTGYNSAAATSQNTVRGIGDFFRKDWKILLFLTAFYLAAWISHPQLFAATLTSGGVAVVFAVIYFIVSWSKSKVVRPPETMGWDLEHFEMVNRILSQDIQPQKAIDLAKQALQEQVGQNQVPVGMFLAQAYFVAGEFEKAERLLYRLIALEDLAGPYLWLLLVHQSWCLGERSVLYDKAQRAQSALQPVEQDSTEQKVLLEIALFVDYENLPLEKQWSYGGMMFLETGTPLFSQESTPLLQAEVAYRLSLVGESLELDFVSDLQPLYKVCAEAGDSFFAAYGKGKIKENKEQRLQEGFAAVEKVLGHDDATQEAPPPFVE